MDTRTDLVGSAATIIHHRHPDLISRVGAQHEMPEMTFKLLLRKLGGEAVFLSRIIGEADRLWTNEDNRFITGGHGRRTRESGTKTACSSFYRDGLA